MRIDAYTAVIITLVTIFAFGIALDHVSGVCNQPGVCG